MARHAAQAVITLQSVAVVTVTVDGGASVKVVLANRYGQTTPKALTYRDAATLSGETR